MDELNRIVDQLERAYDGDSWAGPSLRAVLADVTAAQATARPFPSAHSIGELVGHITAWQRVLLRRLAGEAIVDLPDQENFPPLLDANEAAWQKRLADLAESHQHLRAAVRRLSDADLERLLPGKGTSVYVTVHGVVQHNVYHTAQIALLKKA